MEASQALTYKLLKTHVLSNANETVMEQAVFHTQTHTKKASSDFNVPLPLAFTSLFVVNATEVNNSVDGFLRLMKCIHLQHYCPH